MEARCTALEVGDDAGADDFQVRNGLCVEEQYEIEK